MGLSEQLSAVSSTMPVIPESNGELVGRHDELPGLEENAEYVELATPSPLQDDDCDDEDPADNCSDRPATSCDAMSYASSEVSTAVSRSARRRRGRRVAKAKASKNSATMPILESPAPEDLTMTEDDKKDMVSRLEAGGEAMRRAIFDI